MLHIEAVEITTFNLLEELLKIKELSDFNLAGGTALSLKLGHRTSEDLDIFKTSDFDKLKVINALKKKYKNRVEFKSSPNNKLGVFCFIDEIKIDICKHPYALLHPPMHEGVLRMWSLPDIAAAKVYAISNRATKKDFWDIDELLDIYSIDEIAEFYRKKYMPMLAIGVAQMLLYFDEAEDTKEPYSFKKITWSQVKKNIAKKINQQLK
ncbi:MAG: nucleotidyl transferase AbiEii/AbiGii toxin family protein [Ginsengibacter sp.]